MPTMDGAVVLPPWFGSFPRVSTPFTLPNTLGTMLAHLSGARLSWAARDPLTLALPARFTCPYASITEASTPKP